MDLTINVTFELQNLLLLYRECSSCCSRNYLESYILFLRQSLLTDIYLISKKGSHIKVFCYLATRTPKVYLYDYLMLRHFESSFFASLNVIICLTHFCFFISTGKLQQSFPLFLTFSYFHLKYNHGDIFNILKLFKDIILKLLWVLKASFFVVFICGFLYGIR